MEEHADGQKDGQTDTQIGTVKKDRQRGVERDAAIDRQTER